MWTRGGRDGGPGVTAPPEEAPSEAAPAATPPVVQAPQTTAPFQAPATSAPEGRAPAGRVAGAAAQDRRRRPANAPRRTSGAGCGAREARPGRFAPPGAVRASPAPGTHRRRSGPRPPGAVGARSRSQDALEASACRAPAPGARRAPGCGPWSGSRPPPRPASARPRSPSLPAGPETQGCGGLRRATPTRHRANAAGPARPGLGPCRSGREDALPAAVPCRGCAP